MVTYRENGDQVNETNLVLNRTDYNHQFFNHTFIEKAWNLNVTMNHLYVHEYLPGTKPSGEFKIQDTTSFRKFKEAKSTTKIYQTAHQQIGKDGFEEQTVIADPEIKIQKQFNVTMRILGVPVVNADVS